jgi:type II secretory pathway pseudopilin PulG
VIQACSKRSAMSLLELLAVLSGCGAALGLAALLLHQTMRSQIDSREVFQVERNAQRLARQFRADVHAAQSARSEEPLEGSDRGALLLSIRLASGAAIRYHRRHDAIVRTSVSRENRVVARECYLFGEGVNAEIRRQVDPARWTLHVTSPPPSAEATEPPSTHRPPVWLEVDAIAGKSLRYQRTASDNSVEEAP